MPPALGFAGGGLAGYFGTPDYGKAYNNYGKSIENLSQSYNPYIRGGAISEKGLGALGMYGLANPAGLENRMASSYQMSPFQQQQLTDLSKQMDANAAMTGMLGSTSSNIALQNALASQQNEWQQQYIDRATNQYNTSLNNLNSLGMMIGNQGFNALNSKNSLMNESYLAKLKSQMSQAPWQSGLTSAVGTALGFL